MDVSDITEANMALLTGQGYTKEDLTMLAETEVDALLFKESTEEKADPHDAAALAQDEATAAAAKAAETTPAAEAAKVVATDEPAEEVSSKPALALQYDTTIPADTKERIKTLRSEVAASFKQLMDGTIEAEDYQRVLAKTEDEIDELKTKVMQAEIFERANLQNAEHAARMEWKAAETAQFELAKADGLDYRNKPALLAAYNHNLKALGADPKNERRDAPWFLTEAHRLTKEDLGITTVAKIVSPLPGSGVDKIEMPPTLRNVPAAANGAVNTDEFAHMRSLEGLALEKAHAALTEAQRDRWMAE